MNEILLLIGITLIPMLELRASIPFGIFSLNESLSWIAVVIVCIITNIFLGWIVYIILGPVFSLFRRWKWFDSVVWPILERTRKRIHPYVEKYGELGVAVFIGIPLPGSGVYTGAFGAYLLGVDKRKFAVANVIGVFIAAAAVSFLCLLIMNGVVKENSWISRLFLQIKG